MNYISPNFQIEGRKSHNKVRLTQHILHPAVHTKDIPDTLRVLESFIPSIFENKCFNGKNLPFKSEAQDTEIGHLFEHLVIENLKILSIGKYGHADFKGVTCWDWRKEEKGMFNITISSKEIEDQMFSEAFRRSVNLLEIIFETTPRAGKSFPALSAN